MPRNVLANKVQLDNQIGLNFGYNFGNYFLSFLVKICCVVLEIVCCIDWVFIQK